MGADVEVDRPFNPEFCNAEREGGHGIVADEGADHEDVAVGEIDEAQDAIDHRVAQRDERVDRAERKSIDELL